MQTQPFEATLGERLHLPTAVVSWRSAVGVPMATLVCKATYELSTGAPLPTSTPEPLRAQEELWPTGQSVRRPGDLAAEKRGFEVIVAGHVHAPWNRPARFLRARLRVGDIEKVVDVHGERTWGTEGIAALPFLKMPIVLERSASGLAAVSSRADGITLLPNFVPAGHVPNGDPIPDVGMGARCTAASPLSAFAAPHDQRSDGLAPGSVLELDHLHPTIPFVRTTLPRLTPIALLKMRGREVRIALWADTLVIDADRGLLELVFRGWSELTSDRDTVEATLFNASAADDRDVSSLPEPAQLAPQMTLPSLDVSSTPLPFSPSPPPPSPQPSPPPPPLLTPPAHPEAAAEPTREPKPLDAAELGTLMAQLDLDPGSRERALESRGLDDDGWHETQARFERDVRVSLREGDPRLRDQIDTAYLAEFERRRGELDRTVAVRLVKATDAAQVTETAAWPRQSVPRLVRALLRRDTRATP
ncbi:MAG: DUF2169 domain-containing protein [Polyangiaceae bacterium]|nr:DUF2169 domain-containing protein [Polyangiaceae bacterium]